jgi:hypothetical protein
MYRSQPSTPKKLRATLGNKSFDLNSSNSAEQEGAIQTPRIVSQKQHVRQNNFLKEEEPQNRQVKN